MIMEFYGILWNHWCDYLLMIPMGMIGNYPIGSMVLVDMLT